MSSYRARFASPSKSMLKYSPSMLISLIFRTSDPIFEMLKDQSDDSYTVTSPKSFSASETTISAGAKVIVRMNEVSINASLLSMAVKVISAPSGRL